jgi:hypothetical protein
LYSLYKEQKQYGYPVNKQCCGSGSPIPDPDFYPSPIPDLASRIPDPKTEKKRGVKKISCHALFSSHKFHKIENYFIYEMLKKKMWANFHRIIELFAQKLPQSSQK